MMKRLTLAVSGKVISYDCGKRSNCKAKRCRTKIEDRIQCHKDSLKEAPVEPEAPSDQTL